MTIGSTASAESTAHQPTDATGSSRRGRSRGQRSWRRSRLALALGLIITSAVAAGGTATQADGDPHAFTPPEISVTAATSAAHPGMILVAWSVAGEPDPTDRDASYRFFRLQWGKTNDTNVSEAVIVQRDLPFTSLVIPSLSEGEYAVTMSGRPQPWRPNPMEWVATTSVTVTVDADAPAADMECPPAPNPPVGPFGVGTPSLLCITPTNASPEADMNFVLYKDSQSGDMAASVGAFPQTYVWGYNFPAISQKCDGELTTSCMDTNESEFMLARVAYRDRKGVSTTRWWTAFGDTGTTFFNATQVLVPTTSSAGPPVHLSIDLTEGDFITLEGELRKGEGEGAQLEAGSFTEEGVLIDNDQKDFINPCVKVFNAASQFVNLDCGFGGRGFGVDEDTPGKWRMRLPQPAAGDFYKLRFEDRLNFDPNDGVLAYRVKFATQWCGAPAEGRCNRVERFADAHAFTTTTSGLNGVLREAQQLTVTVSAVPEAYNGADIRLYDEVAQRWIAGALEVASTDGDTKTWTANVTALVQDRPYRIYFAFWGPGVPSRVWLVGGGDLQTAPGVVPGTDLTEPWPNRPYAVTVHNADGSLIEERDSACLALIRSDDSVAASACNDGDNFFGSFGFIQLQRVVPGTYRAIAWRTNNPENAILVGAVEVPGSDQVAFLEDALNPSDITAAAGISNWTGQSLDGTWSVPKPEPDEGAINYDTPTNSAVIIP